MHCERSSVVMCSKDGLGDIPLLVINKLPLPQIPAHQRAPWVMELFSERAKGSQSVCKWEGKQSRGLHENHLRRCIQSYQPFVM